MLTDMNYYLSYLEKISIVYITVTDFSLQIETVRVSLEGCLI